MCTTLPETSLHFDTMRLRLITFNYGCQTSSTKPNSCTNFSHSHSVHSQFWHSLIKFLNIDTFYMKNVIFLVSYHIWPLKIIIKSIYLSIYLWLLISSKKISKYVHLHIHYLWKWTKDLLEEAEVSPYFLKKCCNGKISLLLFPHPHGTIGRSPLLEFFIFVCLLHSLTACFILHVEYFRVFYNIF